MEMQKLSCIFLEFLFVSQRPHKRTVHIKSGPARFSDHFQFHPFFPGKFVFPRIGPAIYDEETGLEPYYEVDIRVKLSDEAGQYTENRQAGNAGQAVERTEGDPAGIFSSRL